MEKKAIKKTTKTTQKKEVKPKKDELKGITKLFNLYFLEYMLYSLVFLGVGIVLLTNPALATRIAEIVTAIVLIVVGLGNGFNYALTKKIKIFDFSIIYSIIALILGVLILTNPFELINFLAIAFGIFLIASGLVKYNFALTFKFAGEESWKLVLTMSLLSMIFGVVIIINPFVNLYFTQVIGLFMFMHGIIDMTHTILLKQRSKYFLNLIK